MSNDNLSLLTRLDALTYEQLLGVLRAQYPRGKLPFDPTKASDTRDKPSLADFLVTQCSSASVTAAVNAAELAARFSEPAATIAPAIPPIEPSKPVTKKETTPMNQVTTPAPPAAPTGSLDALFGGLIAAHLSANPPQVDYAKVADLARDAVKDIVPRPIEVKSPAGVVTIEERTHPLFEKVLRLLMANVHVLLVGPAGCGKTTLAAQCARALKVAYHRVPYTAGASESWLLGRFLPTGDAGRFEYSPSQAMNHYESGGLTLHDEIDAGDPNMLLILNSLTDGADYFANPVSGRSHARHERAYMMAAANTHGTGADIQYVGRNQLDAATLDRWYIVEMDYDAALEKSLTTPFWFDKLANLRRRARKAKLQRTVSTRMMIKAARAEQAGIAQGEIMSDLVSGWSPDELKACGL